MSTREDGLTLAEVVVAVAILGIAFAVVVGAMMSAVVSSDVDRKQAAAQNALRTAAEEINAEAYDPCPGTPAYGASVTPPTGFTLTVSTEFWSGTAFQATCPPTDQGLQRLHLTLAHSGGKASESVEMMKRTP